MKRLKPGLGHSLLALSLGAIVLGAALPALADDSRESAPIDSKQDQRLARMHFVLDKMAERLEIKPSQMQAWKDFSATFASLRSGEMHRPPRDGDAAQLLQYRAERARQMADRLTTLAQATTTLETVLSPEQKAVLDEMVRTRLMGRGRFGDREGGHRGWDGHGKDGRPDWGRG
jgi:hypothetical protein